MMSLSRVVWAMGSLEIDVMALYCYYMLCTLLNKTNTLH